MKAPRMIWWLVLAIAGLGVTWWLAPAMVKVTIYKLTLAPAAAYVYYRLDRAISEPERPHELLVRADRLRHIDPARADALEAWARHRYLRRTILIAAGLIAVALAS